MPDYTPPTAADYKAIFEDHRTGARILEDLIKRFARPAVTEGGIDAVLKTFNNAGQRKVIDFIAARINQANGVDDDEPQA